MTPCINIVPTNKWVDTIRIQAKLRITMRDKVNIKESSTQIELVDTAKKIHREHV